MAWLDKQLTDDHTIVMSQELTGEMSVKPKKNEKRVTFAFAADSFKRKDDVGHIAFGETPMIAFAVCKDKDLSEETKKMVAEHG